MSRVSDDLQVEDQLVDYTDRLLSSAAGEPPEVFSTDEETHALQQMVTLLLPDRTIDGTNPAFKNRLRSTLQAEWNRNKYNNASNNSPGQGKTGGKQQFSFLPRYRGSRVFIPAAYAALSVLLFILAAFPPKLGAQTGAAGVNGTIQPALIIFGVICTLIVLWMINKKES